jgi:hypothetical protein
MERERRIHIEQCLGEIDVWAKRVFDDLQRVSQTGEDLPSFFPPPSVVEAFDCVKLGLTDEGVHDPFLEASAVELLFAPAAPDFIARVRFILQQMA